MTSPPKQSLPPACRTPSRSCSPSRITPPRRQKQQRLLNIRRKVEQVQNLSHPSPTHMSEPGQFRLIGHHTVTNQPVTMDSLSHSLDTRGTLPCRTSSNLSQSRSSFRLGTLRREGMAHGTIAMGTFEQAPQQRSVPVTRVTSSVRAVLGQQFLHAVKRLSGHNTVMLAFVHFVLVLDLAVVSHIR